MYQSPTLGGFKRRTMVHSVNYQEDLDLGLSKVNLEHVTSTPTRRKLKYDKVYMYIYLKPIVNLKRTTYTRVLHLKALNVGQ